MNILSGIVIVVLLFFGILGIKKGIIEGVANLISYIIAIIVIYILVKGIGNFVQKSYINVLVALILLMMVRILNHIFKLIIDSLKLASKLPVVNSINHILGIIIGILRGLLLIWVMFIIVGYLNIGGANAWILNQVSQNIYLSIIYKSNIFVPLLLMIQ